jgi:phytoene desaturase
MKRTVAIIGGGLGGLATACYLAKDGYSVTIYEKNEQIGGRAMQFSEAGYTFDLGPSWYWMPHIFEKFFGDFGKKITDYYTLQRLDPSYRVFFSKEEQYDIPAELEDFYKLIETIEPGSSIKLAKILANGRLMLKTSEDKFLYKAYPSVFSMFIKELVIDGIKTNAYLPLETLIKMNFKDSRMRKLVTWHSLFLGASPKNLPSIYSFILNVDFEQGTWYPQGGMYKIIEAAGALAKELGVDIKTSQEISSLEVTNSIVTSAKTTTGEVINADIFISNADYHHTETKLLSREWQTIPQKKWETKTISPSTLLFYIGIDTKLKNALHHNYYFSLDNWDQHFNTLFDKKKKDWPQGVPSYYFHATSKTDSNSAPDNGESIFVLVPVASGLDDTDEIREELFNRIVGHIEMLTETDIRNHIVVKRIHAHKEHTALYNAYLGNNFGLAQTLFQTGAFRPYNQSRKVKNLYYVGHYTHPGIGLPMVLISGKVTADLVKKS